MDDYKILRQLGCGSYGSAHLAVHVPSGTKCVVKEIKISHMSAKELQEARREVEVLSSLSHVYITQFRYSCESSGKLYIAMDYCGGGDLHTLITKRNGVLFPEDRILDWFVQLCLAVKYIHDRRILHRDIKSQNIFLTDEGRVRLGDFGIAKVMNSTSDLARTCIGTPYYLSPEMCENKPYNNKSDIWALGCVLYEMTTLKHAFEANNMKALILKIIKGVYQPIPPRYSRELRMLHTQIFQREPQSRPSISVILRKPFILKRVPKFISGCEEEDLMASLMKRKISLPASVRRIPPVKRPKDVTDPAAKYGNSLATGRHVTSKSPSKSSRMPQAVSGAVKKYSAAANTRVDNLRRDQRLKCPSEDNRPSPEQKTGQKRSKSVPRVFKQTIQKPTLQCSKKKKQPSPMKLQLMLDSAGFKENADKKGTLKSIQDEVTKCSKQNLEKSLESCKDLHSQRQIEERVVDTVSSDTVAAQDNSDTKNDGGPARSNVDAILQKIKQGKILTEKEFRQRVSVQNNASNEPEGDCNKDNDTSIKDREKQEKNLKEVKDLTNKTLKEQSEHGSDDDDDEDEFSLDVPAEDVRRLVQEKMQKLVQLRAQKMNKMIRERRQWAYQREKLISSLKSESSGPETPPDGYRPSSGSDFDLNEQLRALNQQDDNSKQNLADVSKSCDKMLEENKDNEAPEKHSKETEKTKEDLIKTVKRKMESESDKNEAISLDDIKVTFEDEDNTYIKKGESKSEVEKESDEKCKINTKDGQNITDYASLESELQDSDSIFNKEQPVITSPKSGRGTPTRRARWGSIKTAGLENSPLESTASEMESTSSQDMVMVFSKVSERKQWEKGCKDIVDVLAEAQIIESPLVQKVVKKVSDISAEDNVKGKITFPETSQTSDKSDTMGSTYTVSLDAALTNRENKSVDSVIKASEVPISKKEEQPLITDNLNSTFTIGKQEVQNISSLKETPCTNTIVLQNIEAIKDNLSDTYVLENTLVPKPSKNLPSESVQIQKQVQDGLDKGSTYDINKVQEEESKPQYDRYEVTMPECPELNSKHSTTSIRANSTSKKMRGGLLGMLRSHMSPKPKKKQTSCNSIALGISENDDVGDQESKKSITNSTGTGEENSSKTMKLKTGIVGILRRLSSKHDDLKYTNKTSLTTTGDFSKKEEIHAERNKEPSEAKEIKPEIIEDQNKVALQTCTITEDSLKPDKIKEVTTEPRNEYENGTKENSENEEPLLNLKNVTIDSDESYFTTFADSPERETFSTPRHDTIGGILNKKKSLFLSDGGSDFSTKEEYVTIKDDESLCTTDLKINDRAGMKLLESTSDFLPVTNPTDTSADSGLDTQKTSFTCQTTEHTENSYTSNLHDSCEFSHYSVLSDIFKEHSNISIDPESREEMEQISSHKESEATEKGKDLEKKDICSPRSCKTPVNNDQSVECIAHSLVSDIIEIARKRLAQVKDVSTPEQAISNQVSETGSDKDESIMIASIKSKVHEILMKESPQHKNNVSDKDSEQEMVEPTQSCLSPNDTEETAQEVKASPNIIVSQAIIEEVESTILAALPPKQNERQKEIQPRIVDREEKEKESCNRSVRKRPTTLPNIRSIPNFSDIPLSLSCDFPRAVYEEKNIHCKTTKKEKEDRHRKHCWEDDQTDKEAGAVNMCLHHFHDAIECSTSDEELEDIASLRESMELILSSEGSKEPGSTTSALSSVALSEVWHLDSDGAVVMGGGGVYGWIEEKRARLEDLLGMELFMKAYHLLDSAQEREGCVVGESINQVEEMLGPDYAHLAHDVLQLVVADAVYHN